MDQIDCSLFNTLVVKMVNSTSSPAAASPQFAAPSAVPPARMSLSRCLSSDGTINIEKYRLYRQSADAAFRWRSSVAMDGELNTHRIDRMVAAPLPKAKLKRAPRGVLARKDTEDGPLEIIWPEDSLWYKAYVRNFLMLEPKSFMAKKFRERFRLPYPNFLQLVASVSESELFDRWCGYKPNNKQSSPIELLVLGSLRYLGRGFTFDDIEENTAISKEVHRTFFHRFVEFGSTVLYEKYVQTPDNVDEAKTHMREFEEAGFPGCVGSSDATHITTDRCEYNLKNNHLGPKSSLTARSYNLCVNHRRRILHSTPGGPARWNDQTMVRFDRFITQIRSDGLNLQENTFELLARGKGGEVIAVKYKGVYVIVDNGYLNWSCTVPPFTVTSNTDEIRWSRWLESMRKDVECTFGILKGRWRILKAGVRIHGVDGVDDVWLTCCALHNWLLDIDGLSGEWKNGVPVSDWEGPIGGMDLEGIDAGVANMIARLSKNLNPRNYDSSGMGPGNDLVGEVYGFCDSDCEEGIDEGVETSTTTELKISSLSLPFFRSKLVAHFSILFERNQIVWPKSKRR